MVNDLSPAEIRLIQSLLSMKHDDQIAHILGKPVDEVTDNIDSHPDVFKRPSRKPKPSSKKKTMEPAPVTKPKPAGKEISLRLEYRRRNREKAILQNRKKFQTKADQVAGKIPVRLNAKTVIYVKPGTTKEEIEIIKNQLRIQ